jgi:flagellar L-ring protein precursor FlgH
MMAGIVTDQSFVQGDSLWKRRDPQRGYLFRDSKARAVGDLITVDIDVASQVQNQEDNAMEKTTGASAAFDFQSTSGGGLGTHAANAAMDTNKSSQRSFDGEATYRDSREFIDQMTVTVTDVLPNGNLVFCGQRNVTIAGEHRTLVVSGVVRAIDLGPDNRVNSRYVADFKTVYEGEGASKKFVHQGWLGKAVNKVWPF